jgi:hypothetical protein
MAMLPSLAWSAVQCTCPRVLANGTGNTSCSAAESNSRCSLDFNLFGPEREQRAAELLAQHTGVDSSYRPPAGLNSVEALRAAEAAGQDSLVETVLLFLTVALGNQTATESSSRDLAQLREIAAKLRSAEFSGRLVETFGSAASGTWASRSDAELAGASAGPSWSQGGAIGAPGCVEIRTGDLWLMFKAAWSPVRLLPRCGN